MTYDVGNLPEGATIDPTTGAFSWRPNDTQIGSHTLLLSANDGYQTITRDIEVVVSPLESGDDAGDAPDAGPMPDAGGDSGSDAGADTGAQPDADHTDANLSEPGPAEGEGCGCTSSATPQPSAAALLVLLAVGVLRRRD